MPRDKKYTLGVGDFDTSDLRDGHRPSNFYRYKNTNKTARHNHSSPVGQSRISITGSLQQSHTAKVGHYQVIINRYDMDNSKIQVFIDDLTGDNCSHDTMDISELNLYISQHTK